MYCLGLGLTLRPGAFEQYKKFHDDLWPELAEGMRENLVSMAIYRDGNRLYVFAAAPSEGHWQRSRADPILARWDNRMAEFIETDEQSHLAFTILTKAFGFGDFE